MTQTTLFMEQKYLGIINLTSDKSYFQCITDTSYTMPFGYKYFLELDYKNTNSFTVSIEIITASGIDIEEYLTINKSDTWKKIYVNLTPETGLYSSVNGYKIFFNHRLDSGTSEGMVLLDNIKLVTSN